MKKAKLMRPCAHCGQGLRSRAQFCDRCGQPIAAALPSPASTAVVGKVGRGILAGRVEVQGDLHVHGGDAAPVLDPLPAYLRWLERTQSAVRINDIIKGVVGTDAEPLQLRQVFVDLHATLQVPEGLSLRDSLQRSRDRDARPADRRPRSAASRVAELGEGADPREAKTRRVGVWETVTLHPRLVLVGEAGSGKSTVGQFLTLALARARSGDSSLLTRLGDPGKDRAPVGVPVPIPVPLVLRDFAAGLPADHPRGRACDLWDFLRRWLQDSAQDPGWADAIRAAAESEGAWFVFDGWDETHDPLRLALVAEALADFVRNAGSKCRFLLTSRPYAWRAVQQAAGTEEPWKPEGIAPALAERMRTAFRTLHGLLTAQYEVARLDSDQVQAFITAWYRAVLEGDPPWFTTQEAADKKRDLETAATRDDLQPVVTNPLLLTLTASLSATHLPDDRADLFNEIVELLLERWTKRSGSSRSLRELLGRDIRHEDIRQKIEDCAFAAHRGHVGQTGTADIPEGSLKAALASLLDGSDDRAKIVIEFIERRTGLLLGKGTRAGQRQFSCPHRTFQEFLAGCHLAAKEAFTSSAASAAESETPSAVALAREHPGHWREVLCFAARRARPERGSLAAHNLVHGQSFEDWSRLNQPTEADWRCAALAGRQLLEIGLDALRSTEGTRLRTAHVAGWLAALLEHQGLDSVRERFEVGVDLARLGDPRPGVRLKNGLLDPTDFIKLPAGELKLQENGKRTVLEKPFRIARYPVTVEQYEAFVAQGGYGGTGLSAPKPAWWTDDGWEWRNGRSNTASWAPWVREEYKQMTFPILGPRDFTPVFQTANHPRVGVSWFEATAFCGWLTERLQEEGTLDRRDRITLPDEAQWEWAARWNRQSRQADDRRYPWGGSRTDDLAQRCNMKGSDLGHTSAVGLFAAGKADCGAHDLSGNVWEWCEDWYDRHKSYRVVRGGSWYNDTPGILSCGCRNYDLPALRYVYIGFRCVWVSESAR